MLPPLKIVWVSYLNRYIIRAVCRIIISANKGKTISLQNICSSPLHKCQQIVQISYCIKYFIHTRVLTNELSKQNRNNQDSK